MNDELERAWKEAVVFCLKYYPSICLEGLRKLRKLSVKVTGLRAEISTH
jgi:hypothetical protein